MFVLFGESVFDSVSNFEIQFFSKKSIFCVPAGLLSEDLLFAVESPFTVYICTNQAIHVGTRGIFHGSTDTGNSANWQIYSPNKHFERAQTGRRWLN